MPRAYLVMYVKDERWHRSPLYPSYTLAMDWASNHLKRDRDAVNHAKSIQKHRAGSGPKEIVRFIVMESDGRIQLPLHQTIGA